MAQADAAPGAQRIYGKTNRPMTVSVKLFTGAFPERLSLNLAPGARVRDLVAKVKRKSLKGMIRKNSSLLLRDMGQDDLLFILNGRPIQNLQGYDTPLEDGDVLAVFPVMAGG
jgi:molybdopterin converting factor small subunit